MWELHRPIPRVHLLGEQQWRVAAGLDEVANLLCVANRKFPAEYPGLKKLARVGVEQKVTLFSGNVLRSVEAGALMEQFERSRCEALDWAVDVKQP